MKIWALADLHLSFSVPAKSMEIFGEHWSGYHQKIEENWRASIAKEDLVLIAGDITWAMRIEEAIIDLEWIDALPGTKVVIRGNHDYWWSSISKVRKALPPSIHAIQNDCATFGDVAVCGTRLWDNHALRFSGIIPLEDEPHDPFDSEKKAEDDKILQRELGRLEMSLAAMPKTAERRICMTHYPPTNFELETTAATRLLEEYKIETCLFGHLHALEPGEGLIGEKNGVKYYLTACDYLGFQPLEISNA